MKIYNKIEAIQLQLSVSKTWKNPFFKSSYITLDDILTKLRPLLLDQKLILINENITGWVITRIINSEDVKEEIVSKFEIEWQRDPQKLWAILTYWRRYNLVSIFDIIADRDDDWESFYERNKKKEEAKKEAPAEKKKFTAEDLERLMEKPSVFIDSINAVERIGEKRELTTEDVSAIQSLYK